MWLFTWEGRISRLPYFLAAVILVALKYAIDRSVATKFHQPWHIWNYIYPQLGGSFAGLANHRQMYIYLWGIAIPFFWAGVALTLRRLRDAGRHAGWVFLLFVPLANLAMFLWLSLAPGVDQDHEDDTAASTESTEVSEDDGRRRAIAGVVVATALGLCLVSLDTRILVEYAWGLFLGVPFLTGFVASWFLNVGGIRTGKETATVCMITTLLIGVVLLGFAMEGALCLVMALPLALPFSIAGGEIAREILRRRPDTPGRPTFAACITVLPMIMFTEHATRLEPPVLSVTSSIIIDAPVSTVWKNVISFPPLAPPEELIFRAGIAYPIGAEIKGPGPGAVRYCRFSTGDFVEPVTTWDENHLLGFDVAAQPQSLREISPWKVMPPHLERNYMRSKHGQFRLVALDEHRTLLEGTTWYQNYFWPQAYWRGISDSIVHDIHMRVLEHVKRQAEAH